MFYKVSSFTEITKAERPSKEQVAGALATSYAIGRGKQVPVKEAIDEDIDRAELYMPDRKTYGIVESENEQGAIQKVVDINFDGSVPKDIRFHAEALGTLYKVDGTVVIA